MIYLLLIFLIILFLTSYILLDRDLFAPAVIICMVYIVSILSACVNVNVWKIDLHFNTFLIIVFGTIIFIIANVLVNYCISIKLKKTKNRNYECKKQINLMYINIRLFKTILVCMFQLFTAITYYNAVKNITGRYGNYQSFSDLMMAYRSIASYSTELSVSTGINQMVKVSYACAAVYLYIFINNMVVVDKNKNSKQNYINLVPIIIYGVQIILTGGRFNLLILICGAIIIYNMLWHKKYGWHKNFKIKTLVKCIIGLILVFSGFYFLKSAVGRNSEKDFITYITAYSGGSIQLFDMYMQDPIEKSNIWGKETFYALNMFLQKIGLIKSEAYIQHLEFRSSNGIMIGNVYTAYRRYIQDFGIVGMFILQFLFSLFYSLFYNYIKNKKVRNKLDYSLLVYAFISFPLFMHSINDYFYSNIISINYLTIFVLFWIMSYLVIRIKFRVLSLRG